MSLGKLITIGAVSALLAAVTYLAADYYFKSQRIADGIEAPVQIYAGEPLPEATASSGEKPALYSCADERMRVYLVIADTGEFMLFDGAGAWVNNGRFFQATSDKGVHYWHAEIGNSLLGLVKKDNIWHLAVVTPQESMELICV